MEICDVVRELVMMRPGRVILSGVRDKAANPYRKVTIRPVMIRGEEMMQIERFTQKQAFQKNILPEDLGEELTDLLADYLQLDFWSAEYTGFVKISQKGKVLYRKKPALENGETNDTEQFGCSTELSGNPETTGKKNPMVGSQNREKKYLLNAKDAPRPLVDLGVVTRKGMVVAKRYDKFKQINRFVELVDEAIEPEVKELNIVDFGCGKSYLTFVLYDYLTRVRKIRASVIGLDLKEDVIKECNRIAERYGYEDLWFEVGDINGYQPEQKVDMVISLHACDTATDFALYNAICWNTPRILSVPCCQHEINHQLNKKSALSISEYGLIRERFAALLTDAMRADILQWQGYKTDVVEFVDMEHSPKNLMIRATKKDEAGSSKGAGEAYARVMEAVNAYHIEPTLLKLLSNDR